LRTLLILNDPAYGTERSFNGLRLAGALAKRDDSEMRVSAARPFSSRRRSCGS
jgi:sulfur relay (sulfurtransferase) complex TusBCD TusD component (DsrE family)